MVADPRGQGGGPRIDVHMVKGRRPGLDGSRNECMVELLRVLVEHVAVSLFGRDPDGDVDIGEHGFDRLERRPSLQELVEIAGHDDVGVLALG